MANKKNFRQLIIENINLNEYSQNKIQELKNLLGNKLVELTKCNADLDKRINNFDKTKFTFEEKISIPPLPDYYERVELGYLIPENRHRREWYRKDKQLLANGIRLRIIQKRTSIANQRLRHILNQQTHSELKTNLIEEVAELRTKYESMTLADLVTEQDEQEDGLDWPSIANTYLNNSHSGQECENMWNLYLHPKFNKCAWTEKEDSELKKIVQKYKRQNWSAIANELNTGRSEFQCFERYLRFKKSPPWTSEEDERLPHLVEQSRLGSYIHWPFVMAHLPNRTRQQLYKRWIILKEAGKKFKNNSFTIAEDLTLLAAARIVGDGYRQLAEYLPHRKSTQVRSHWIRLRLVALPLHFSNLDFQDLWVLMKRYPSSNPRIYRHFHYLKFFQLKSRIRFLEKISKEENFQIQNLKILPKKPIKRFHQKLEEARELARYTPPDQLFKKISANFKENSIKNSTILNHLKPRGRPSKKKDPLNRNLFEFFRMTYHKHSGRDKINFTDDEYTRLENSTKMWSQLLNLQLNPNKLPKTSPDDGLEESLLQATAGDTGASHVEVNHRIRFAPPALANLVGFRTMLLSQRNLCHNLVPNEYYSTRMSTAAIQAKERLMKRMVTMFIGPFFLSNSNPNANILNKEEQTPAIECYVETTEAENERGEEEHKKKKKRPGKKRPVPLAALEARRHKYQKKAEETTVTNESKHEPPKRTYIKTGKYKKEKMPIDDKMEIRRSCRNSSNQI